MYKLLIIIYLLLIKIDVCSQNWEHTFDFNSKASIIWNIVKDYDGGFLVASKQKYLYNNEYHFISSLFKLDNNGNILWFKDIGKQEDRIVVGNICILNDGSIILSGYESKFTESASAYILKLNACKELEWIKPMGTTLNYDDISHVIKLQDGNILAKGDFINDKRLNLIKMDLDGNIIWKKR